ncbi:MAG: pilin [Kangiellaceae bacterium]|nr:pilin [Kangiellaceae bacterium]MCW9016638.1 pilin [Kangiellaceae bacterium]
MFKNFLVVLTILIVVAGGIGYSYFSDEQWHERRLFTQSLESFGHHQQTLTASFIKDGQIPAYSKTLALNYTAANNAQLAIDLQISTANNQVILRFGQGESQLAEQTILLEPVVKQLDDTSQQVLWKCLNGTVLLKYRPKACRLGEAILISSN